MRAPGMLQIEGRLPTYIDSASRALGTILNPGLNLLELEEVREGIRYGYYSIRFDIGTAIRMQSCSPPKH